MNDNESSMIPLTGYERWYGRAKPPPDSVPLCAGRLALDFQAGDLRTIRLGSQELIRRVYVAVRDVNWNTIPGHISQLEINSADSHFQIRYQSLHQAGPLIFRWKATITGDKTGHIHFTMDGTTGSDFRYCRIGFCVLHPVGGIAGSPYKAQTPSGIVEGMLPELIAPQLIKDGFEEPLFPSCSQLVVRTPTGIDIRTDFKGDLFEMEDQRNWTDGSFKTYCTPLSLGYPHQTIAGQTIRQEVIISADGPLSETIMQAPATSEPLAVSLTALPSGVLPHIGFGLPAENLIPSACQADLLAALHPAHLKVELHLENEGWPLVLERAIRAVELMGGALELAVFLADDTEQALSLLASSLVSAPIARLIVFHESDAAVRTTSPHHMRLAHEKLGGALPGVPFVGGTNGNLAELNRTRPATAAMDGVTFTINPQVHADDELSLIEAIEAQRDAVVTARSFSNGLPITVSSVTLKPPFNQAATEEESLPDPLSLPAAVDERQMSLFAAAWTVASLRALAEGGAESVTYYETHGWRGLIELERGNPLPTEFRSWPGMVFPVYWVFHALANTGRSSIRSLLTDRPLDIDGFGVQSEGHLALLLVNLRPVAQEIVLTGLPNGEARLRHLNENTMPLASSDADGFQDRVTSQIICNRSLTLSLLPYETLFARILSS